MQELSIFSEMWGAYRGTIMRSIVTSFGLDFLVHDQNGGDVDTVRSVRVSGTFKNERNASAYEARGDYDGIAYHHDDAYVSMIKAAKASQTFIDDAYVPGNRIYYGKASALSSEELVPGFNRRANLDHVISAKEIHDDRGRVLAGLDGVELANQEYNLRFTNEHLNKSMGQMTIDEYIQWRSDRGDPLPEDVQSQMRKEDAIARQEYDRRINTAYYSSDKFLRDAGLAAAQRGIEMGLRQALGFIFIEIWCSCEDEIKELKPGVTLQDCTKAVTIGIQKGIDNARLKYKDLVEQFEQGFTAGALASLTTTLINIFISTDKNTVRYIRQAYTVVVQVGNILLNNPQDLLLGDQMKSATVALATGASVLAGTAVGNQIAKTPVGQDKQLGIIVQNFCASLVSGLISCTLLIMIDRSQFISEIVGKMNQYGSVDHSIRETSSTFVALAAEVAQCDVSQFQRDVAMFDCYARKIRQADDDQLHDILVDVFEEFDIPLPWEGSFDDFMGNSANCLVFE